MEWDLPGLRLDASIHGLPPSAAAFVEDPPDPGHLFLRTVWVARCGAGYGGLVRPDCGVLADPSSSSTNHATSGFHPTSASPIYRGKWRVFESDKVKNAPFHKGLDNRSLLFLLNLCKFVLVKYAHLKIIVR